MLRNIPDKIVRESIRKLNPRSTLSMDSFLFQSSMAVSIFLRVSSPKFSYSFFDLWISRCNPTNFSSILLHLSSTSRTRRIDGLAIRVSSLICLSRAIDRTLSVQLTKPASRWGRWEFQRLHTAFEPTTSSSCPATEPLGPKPRIVDQAGPRPRV